MKNFVLSALLAAAALPAMASDYYVVVPIKGKAAAPGVSEISVALSAAALPGGRTSAAYSYDFKPLLVVTGDAAYTDAGVTWAVTNGALPTGLAFDGAAGNLTGTPTAAGTYSFTVQARYKAKLGAQSYSLLVAQAAPRQIVVGSKTFALAATAQTDWTGAQAACAQAVDGTTGWRLPSMAEQTELFNAKGTSGIAAAGWPTAEFDWYWSSDPYTSGRQIVSRPWNNSGSVCNYTGICAIAACVK